MTLRENGLFHNLGFLTFFLFALGLLGCVATTSINSAKKASYDRKIERVFVISHIASGLGDSFAKAFEQSMSSGFTSNKISVETATVLELDLDYKVHKKRLDEFKPDTVLVLKNIGGTKTERGIIIEAKFDVRLMDMHNNIIWRAKVDFYPEDLGNDDADVLAKDILGKLKEDEVF